MAAILPPYNSPSSPIFVAGAYAHTSRPTPILPNYRPQLEVRMPPPLPPTPAELPPAPTVAPLVDEKAQFCHEFFTSQPDDVSGREWLVYSLTQLGFPGWVISFMLVKIFTMSQIYGFTTFKFSTLVGWMLHTPQTVYSHLARLERLGIIIIRVGPYGKHDYCIHPYFTHCFYSKKRAKPAPIPYPIHNPIHNPIHTEHGRNSPATPVDSMVCGASDNPTLNPTLTPTLTPTPGSKIISKSDDCCPLTSTFVPPANSPEPLPLSVTPTPDLPSPSLDPSPTATPSPSPINDDPASFPFLPPDPLPPPTPILATINQSFLSLTGRLPAKRDENDLFLLSALPPPFIIHAFQKVALYKFSSGHKIQTLKYVLNTALALLDAHNSSQASRDLVVGSSPSAPTHSPDQLHAQLRSQFAALQAQLPSLVAAAQSLFLSFPYERSADHFFLFVDSFSSLLPSLNLDPCSLPASFNDLAELCWQSHWLAS